MHLIKFDGNGIFSIHFHQFSTVWRGHHLLYVELMQHETSSDLFFIGRFFNLPQKNIFFNYMTVHKKLNCISQGNLYIWSLYSETEVYIN